MTNKDTSPVSELVERLEKVAGPVRMNNDSFSDLAAEAADRIAALEAENVRLREDKARLDFLDECNHRLNSTYHTSYGWKMIMNHNVNRLMTGHHLDVDLNDFEAFGAKSCRQAIDAERQRVEDARRRRLAKQGGNHGE